METGNNQGHMVIADTQFFPEDNGRGAFFVVRGFIEDSDGSKGRFPVSVIVDIKSVKDVMSPGDRVYIAGHWDELGGIHADRWEKD